MPLSTPVAERMPSFWQTRVWVTSFCISYRAHLLQTRPDQTVAVISLSQTNADSLIQAITDKSSCIIFLDALDEDPVANTDGGKRLDMILEMASGKQRYACNGQK